MIADRELEQELEQQQGAAEAPVGMHDLPRRPLRVVGTYPFSAPGRPVVSPSPNSSMVLVGLVFAGLALWVYIRSVAEEEADLRDLQAARVEVEEFGTVSWEEIKRKHGL